MIESMQVLLQDAQQGKYAVGAFNIGNKDIFEAVLRASHEQNIPAIIAVSVPELEYLGDDFMAYVLKQMQTSASRLALHLDHGKSMAEIKRAIKLGFNSVMIDASHLPFEANIERMKEVVAYAKEHGVAVEGELGTIGSTASSSCIAGTDSQIIYTDPEDAAIFSRETGVDALAVAIGTSHGLYPKGIAPHLKLDLLGQLVHKVTIPLVLHGGSGNQPQELRHAAHHGIAKINISSEVKSAYFQALRKHLQEYPDDVKTQSVFGDPCRAAQAVITEKMILFV